MADRCGYESLPSRDLQVQADSAAPLKVFLVDGQEIVRTGVRAVLAQAKHVEIVGETGTTAAAIEDARRLKPDVMLLELQMPDGSGIDVCRHIRETSPGTQVLVLTHLADDESVVAVLRAGATGVLLKTVSGPDLIRAIDTVAKRQLIIDGAIAQRIMAHLCSLSVTACEKTQTELSAQEKRVMDLVVQGKTNKEIGVALGLSDKTVKNYLRHVYDKLQVTRRAEATSSFLQQARTACGVSAADPGCPLLPLP